MCPPAAAQPEAAVWSVPMLPGPAQSDYLAAAQYVAAHPGTAPAGTNDFHCVPTAEHPRPVILAHGTDTTAYVDWAALAPRIKEAGYCVFAVNYGGAVGGRRYGTEDVVGSARQFGMFVARVRRATRAGTVDVVGFSQGATVSRYWVNKFGGARHVKKWIGLASPTYGSSLYGTSPILEQIPGALGVAEQDLSLAAVQQRQDSPTLRDLNSGGDTVPGVRYSTIGSRVDEIIQPSQNIALRGPGAHNIVVQDRCPADLTGHFHMTYDPYVAGLTLAELGPGAAQPVCSPVALGTGIPEVIIGSHQTDQVRHPRS